MHDHEHARKLAQQLTRKVSFVNHRWIGANRQLTIKDLVKHCEAELELQKSHLKDAKELAAILEPDTKLSSVEHDIISMPSIVREHIFRNFSSWIAAMPRGKMDDLIEILVKQRDELAELKSCVETETPPVRHPLDKSDSSFEKWIMEYDYPEGLTSQMDQLLDSLNHEITMFQLYKYVCASDFTLSELKSSWDDSGRAYRTYLDEANEIAQKSALSVSKEAAEAAQHAADQAKIAAGAAKEAASAKSKTDADKAVKEASKAASLAGKVAQKAAESVATLWRNYARKQIASHF